LVHPAGRVGPVVEPSGAATMCGLGGRLAPADRTARGVAGVGLIVAGVLLGVFGSPPAWVTALIIGIGVVLVAEATLNYCPAAKVRPWNRAQSEKASQGS
jgi:hypothetical protein